MAVLKALSLQQPWASLVAVGAKQIETRSWRSVYRGPLAIHASRQLSQAGRECLASKEVQRALSAAGLQQTALPFGWIVAVCILEDCVEIVAPPPEPERSFGDYRPGRYAWMLGGVRALRRPHPVRGRLGLWWCTIGEAEIGTAQLMPCGPKVAIRHSSKKAGDIDGRPPAATRL